MDFGLQGKVAVVGGGSKGMGLAIAEELAAEGCKVVIAARGQAALDEAVAAIRDRGGTATAVSADLRNREGIERVAAVARETYGDPTIGIFNTNGPRAIEFDDATDQHFLQAYNTLVMAYAWFVKALSPGMKAARWGRFVTIGSLCVKTPHRELRLVLANTARAGALGLARTLADDLAPYGITINTLAPGAFLTVQFRDYYGLLAQQEQITFEEKVKAVSAHIPARRLGDPTEMAAVAAFLCSTRAGYLTGQTLAVDGGQANILQ